MKIIDNILQCTGCTACEMSCPLGSICMTQNEQGFLYPIIDAGKCNECGLCKKICPVNLVKKEQAKQPKVYAVKHKSDSIRFESSSGGFFTVLYEYVIGLDGVVFGVKFDSKMAVIHTKASSIDDCKKFRGSKYVQSTKGSIFKEVKKELKNGKSVFFTGTPCEIAGLNAYLQKPYQNLLTCDFICHGVPSPGLWDDYINYHHNNNNTGSSLISFSFRNKSYGWHNPYVKKVFTNGKETAIPLSEETFGYLFDTNLSLRRSCHTCQYANLNRPSDLTMGDFWTIAQVSEEFDDDKGISQVLINTKKGQSFFDKISKDIISIGANIGDSLQHNLKMPTPINPDSKQFWKDYSSSGFTCIIKTYRPRFIVTKKILKGLGFFEAAIKIKQKLMK